MQIKKYKMITVHIRNISIPTLFFLMITIHINNARIPVFLIFFYNIFLILIYQKRKTRNIFPSKIISNLITRCNLLQGQLWGFGETQTPPDSLPS